VRKNSQAKSEKFKVSELRFMLGLKVNFHSFSFISAVLAH